MAPILIGPSQSFVRPTGDSKQRPRDIVVAAVAGGACFYREPGLRQASAVQVSNGMGLALDLYRCFWVDPGIGKGFQNEVGMGLDSDGTP